MYVLDKSSINCKKRIQIRIFILSIMFFITFWLRGQELSISESHSQNKLCDCIPPVSQYDMKVYFLL